MNVQIEWEGGFLTSMRQCRVIGTRSFESLGFFGEMDS
jgi:hypothetical protein